MVLDGCSRGPSRTRSSPAKRSRSASPLGGRRLHVLLLELWVVSSPERRNSDSHRTDCSFARARGDGRLGGAQLVSARAIEEGGAIETAVVGEADGRSVVGH